MSEYIRAPWTLTVDGCGVADADGGMVADAMACAPRSEHDAACEARARLIAAAPDLLAELRMIADVLHTKVEAREIPGESVFHIVNGIDRAIAKATGSQVSA